MTTRSCPICAKPTDATHKPFCSARCRQVDLGRWFTGAYQVPVKDTDDEDGDTVSDPPLDQTAPRR